ncbi:PH domain-containing protein [Virgibacillus ainsalahensis]
MYFQSRKDTWITLLIWGIALIGILVPLLSGYLSGVLFVLPLSLLLLWFWFSTGYKIEGNKIKVRYGPLRLKVKIEDILEIRKVKNIFAAPALSIHRLEIYAGRYNIISISPRNEKEFIDELVKINPNLENSKNFIKNKPHSNSNKGKE